MEEYFPGKFDEKIVFITVFVVSATQQCVRLVFVNVFSF